MWHRPTRFSPSGVPRDKHRVSCCASRPASTGFCGTRFVNDLSDNRLTLDFVWRSLTVLTAVGCRSGPNSNQLPPPRVSPAAALVCDTHVQPEVRYSQRVSPVMCTVHLPANDEELMARAELEL
jgi:hypothetical protein